MIITKKIYAIIMKKMVKVKNPAAFFKNPAGFFKPRAGFFPHIFKWGKNPAGFFQKNKYLNLFKKQVCLIVIIAEND